MKIYTTFYAQVKKFSSNMLPISTTVSDPYWFHDFKGNQYIFENDQGVYLGFRCEQFLDYVKDLSSEDMCQGVQNCVKDPSTCNFLRIYRESLDKINFDEFYHHLEVLAEKLKVDTIVFVVYEGKNNKCSERGSIQDWFKSHNVECEELPWLEDFTIPKITYETKYHVDL